MANFSWQQSLGDSILFLLAGLLAAVPFVDPFPLWGLSHVAFLPGFLKFIPAIVLALMLVVWRLPTFSECVVELLDRILVGTHWFFPVLFGVIIAAIGLIFPVPTHFLGDGYTVTNSLTSRDPFIWSYSAPGVVLLLRGLQFLFGGISYETGLIALRALSAISAFLFVTGAFHLGRLVGKTAAHRVFIVFALIFTPLSLFWFGYAEHYPIIASALIWWVFCFIRYQVLSWHNLSMTVVLAALFTPFAPLLLVPLIAFMLEKQSRSRIAQLLKHGSVLAIVFISIILAIVLIAAASAFQLHTRGYSLVNALSGSRDSLLSFQFWIDRLNVPLLSLPILFVIAFWQKRDTTRINTALSLAALLCLTGYFTINSVLGASHDWDLLSMFLVPVFLYALVTFDERPLDSKRTLAALLLALITTCSFVIVQLDESAAVTRHHSLLVNRHAKTGMGWRTLEKFYDAQGDTARAGDIAREAILYFPGDALRAQIRLEIERGNLSEAMRLSQRLMIEERNADAYLLRGLTLSGQGLYQQAAADIDSALQLNATLPEALLHRAELFLGEGRYDTALVLLREVSSNQSLRMNALEALAYSWYQLRMPDSMIATARLIREQSPNSPMANLAFVEYSLKIGDTSDAREYLEIFARYGRDFTEYDDVLGFYAPIVGLEIDPAINMTDSTLR